MDEISLNYFNSLARQIITISSLLGGFSIAVIANLLVSGASTKLHKAIVASSTLAACFFLITVFAMTSVLLKTTEGYPHAISKSSLELPNVIGAITFYLGIISLLAIISLSGWTKSKRMGWFSTTVGVITLISIILLTGI
ncbi:MAG: hypothetical protein AAFR61_09580 [Bacteroidota bacterium]